MITKQEQKAVCDLFRAGKTNAEVIKYWKEQKDWNQRGDIKQKVQQQRSTFTRARMFR